MKEAEHDTTRPSPDFLDLAALRKEANSRENYWVCAFSGQEVLVLLDRIEELEGRLKRISELAGRFYASDLVMTNAAYANAAQELVRLSHE